MRQVYTAGEKTFVDYAGQQPQLVDPTTGEVFPVELFVAVLGASNFTYAEATLTQQSADFIASHSRAVEYFGGVSAIIVPDQLRTGVGRPCRYEPGLQRTYAEWAQHYDTVIIPARPRQAPGQGQGRSRRCWSPSAGFWRGCATRSSTRWRRSTPASASC